MTLPRKLPVAACRNLAAQFLTSAKTLQAENRPLGTKSAIAWAATTDAAQTLLATNGDGDFRPLDREADRAFSGLFDLVDSLHAIFEGELVANDPEGAARFAAVTTLVTALDPHARTLVRLPARLQFDAMTRVLHSLDLPAAKTALATLHLEVVVARLAAIVDAYGKRLGILAERAAEGPIGAGVDAFEGALTRLLVHVDSEHDGASDDDRRIRALTIGVYEEAVATQRALDAEARRKTRSKGGRPA
jgi:hypothetical protein